MSTTETVTSTAAALEKMTVNGAKEKDQNLAQVQVMGMTKSGKRLNIRTYPKFDNLEDERTYRKQHLAAAFRVFADRGFDEGVAGHVSVS